ncbi:MAG: DUF167 domain-containing protein [Solirubrobacterales bacterium]
MFPITETDAGIRFEVRVQPRSSKNQVCGVQENAVKIKLTAPPVDGAANEALIAYLATLFSVAKKDVTILRGETGRLKLIEIAGIDRAAALSALENAGALRR